LNLDELTAGLPRTELVYLREMQLAQANAKVVRAVLDKRTHAYIVLDRTIFHPKGGGQPSDRGTVASSNFVLSIKKAIYHKGIVVHWGKLVSGSAGTSPATCELDWGYRYLLMRRHTAAHLLDHCLAQAGKSRVVTTDSWLDELCYVGYGGNPPSEEVLQRVEEIANSMIKAGGEVKIAFHSSQESKSILTMAPNFERLPELDEVRTVQIAGCDPIPCGGTHVANIREIRKLSVVRAEEMPDGSFRLHFSVEP